MIETRVNTAFSGCLIRKGIRISSIQQIGDMKYISSFVVIECDGKVYRSDIRFRLHRDLDTYRKEKEFEFSPLTCIQRMRRDQRWKEEDERDKIRCGMTALEWREYKDWQKRNETMRGRY